MTEPYNYGKGPALIEADPEQLDYYNNVQKEHDKLQVEVRSAIGSISNIACPANTKRWHRLESKVAEMITFWSGFRKIEYDDAQVKNNSTLRGGMRIVAGLLGSSLIVNNILNEEIQIAENDGFNYSFKPVAELTRFAYAREFCINIDGISLGDFPTFQRTKHPAVPYFQYLLKGLYGRTDTNQYISEQNHQFPMDKYPTLAKRAINILSYRLLSLMGLKGIEMAQFARKDRNTFFAEVMTASDRLSSSVQEVRKEAYQILLDPKHAEFAELKDLLMKYVNNSDWKKAFIALIVLGVDDDKSTLNLYRHAVKFAAEGTETKFYSLIADSVRMLVDKAASARHMLDTDDIPAILTENHGQEPDKIYPSIASLSQSAVEIFGRSSQRQYEVDVQNVGWDGLLMPESAIIAFAQGRPQIITLNLSFSNKLGETTELRVGFDTRNNSMNWNALPDPMNLEIYPDNEDAEALKRSVLFAADSILKSISSDLQKQGSGNGKPSADLPIKLKEKSKPRERYVDPVYELRKQVKKENREARNGNSIEMDLGEMITEKAVRNVVRMPGEEMFRHISSADRKIVEDAVNSYNENGIGAQFSRVKHLGFYKLKIGCHVPKGVRVLLTEVESGNGIRTFEVEDIRYRKDSFRLNKF